MEDGLFLFFYRKVGNIFGFNKKMLFTECINPKSKRFPSNLTKKFNRREQ